MYIHKAFCLELKKTVDIVEAAQAYFSQPKQSRNRLTFHCSSPECQLKSDPVIVSGVNYDKRPDRDQFYKRPHFRSQNISAHHDDCEWIEKEVAVANNKSKSVKRNLTDKVSHALINDQYISRFDFFRHLPKEKNNQANHRSNGDALSNIDIRKLSKKERIKQYATQAKPGEIATSHFHELVHSYLEIHKKKAWDTPLNIPSLGKTSYGAYFKRIIRYQSGQDHAYFGSVWIKNIYPKSYSFDGGLPAGISLVFNEEVTVDQFRANPSLYISKSELEAFPGAHGLLESIRLANDKESSYVNSMWCHFIGDITKETILSKNDNEIDVLKVNPINLHYIELVNHKRKHQA